MVLIVPTIDGGGPWPPPFPLSGYTLKISSPSVLPAGAVNQNCLYQILYSASICPALFIWTALPSLLPGFSITPPGNPAQVGGETLGRLGVRITPGVPCAATASARSRVLAPGARKTARYTERSVSPAGIEVFSM